MTTTTGTQVRTLSNFINGEWVPASNAPLLDVVNPATEEVIARVPMSPASAVDDACVAAQNAWFAWRATPPADRVKYLYKWKQLLEENFEEIARLVTLEHGKTLNEGRGDLRRGIDNIDNALGMPMMMQGESLEDAGRGIDCVSYRRPMGVFGIIAPFNFPAMVPLWFMPYALATGNCVVLKSSEQVPMTQARMFELLAETGIPKGVVSLINGGKEVVNAICENPLIQGVSFVGSSPVAKHVYETGTRHGKRVQALGGAKNFVVVMPDAELDKTVQTLVDSCFGCSGQRCLAGATLVFVGDSYKRFRQPLLDKINSLKVGNGMDEGVNLGPVISAQAKARIEGLIAKGVEEGAVLAIDGRKHNGGDKGYFLGASLFEKATPNMTIAQEEIFGPVMVVMEVDTLTDALAIVNNHEYANTTTVFTNSGKTAREFCYHAVPSMIGVNVGVPTPMAFFNFGGAKGSFYGDIKAHGKHGIEFYTDRKVVTSRWF
jgi:malonate-semialdehyde dehydrogenase (acetylating)/methylmalonate-semialdehyde dehydrogenase